MRQILCERSLFDGLSDGYLGFPGSLTGAATFEVQARAMWMADGTFEDLYVEIDSAPGSGNSWTFEVYLGSGGSATSATGMTLTIADMDTSGLSSGSVVVAAGEYLSLRVTSSGSPASSGGMRFACSFESDNVGESSYAQRYASMPDDTNPRRSGVFWTCYQDSGFGTWNSADPVDEFANIVPCDGTITGSALQINQSPGGGSKAWTLVIYHAPSGSGTFTKQDGSGATVDTRLSCSGTTVINSGSFSLPVAAGDRVYYELIPENTPNALGTLVTVATRFVADTDGQSIMGGWMRTTLSTTVTQFFPAHGEHDALSSSEGTLSHVTGPHAISLSLFYGHLENAPGAGDSRTLTVRLNGATPASALEFTITDTDQDGSDTSGTYLITTGDEWEIRSLVTGAPITGSAISFSLVQSEVAPTVVATSIFGEDGTVAGLSRVHLLNMDGVNRTLSNIALENSVCIAGVLTMFELTTPPTAVAGTLRIWLEDNGAGKLRLMGLFPTGAAQQFFIET